jgi:hypothetical protein
MVWRHSAIALFSLHQIAVADPGAGKLLYCAGERPPVDSISLVDCSKPNQVVDALQVQVNWLAERRVGHGIEAFCSRPYNEALFLKENNPTSLTKLAPRLLGECNQALQSMKK